MVSWGREMRQSTRLRGVRRHQCGRQLGFTLVELLLALSVVLISGVWLLGAYQASLSLTELSQQTDVAVDDLKDMLESIKATPFSQLAANFPDRAANGIVGVGADRYGAIIGGYGLQNEQITVTHSPTAATDPRELIVQVTWQHRGRSHQRAFSTWRASQSG